MQLRARLSWVTVSPYPSASDKRGVHTSYALLGDRSALGSMRPGNRVGTIPVGQAPTLAVGQYEGPGHPEGYPGPLAHRSEVRGPAIPTRSCARSG